MALVELACPHCVKRLRLKDDYLGRTIRCPACSNPFKAVAPPALERVDRSPAPKSVEPPAPAVRKARRVAQATDTAATDQRTRSAPPPANAQEQPPRKQVSHDARGAKRSGTAASSSRRTPQPPAAQEDDWGTGLDDPWAFDELTSEDDAYASSPPPRQRTQRQSSFPARTMVRAALLTALILASIGGAAGLGYFVWNNMPVMLGNPVAMSWLPEKLDVFVYVEPAMISASPFAKALMAKLPPTALPPTGEMAPADIESVTVGVWEGAAGAQPLQLPGIFGSMPMAPAGGTAEFLCVIRLSRDVERTAWSSGTIGDHNGVALYNASRSLTSGAVVAEVDSRTLLLGSAASVRAAIDRNGKEFAHSQFKFVSGSGQIVVGGVGSGRPSGTATSSSSFTPGLMAPGNPAAQFGQLLEESARGGSLTINFGSNLTFDATIVCDTSDSAATVEQEIRRSLDEARTQVGNLKSFPPTAALAQPLTDLLGSLTVSTSGSTVSLNGTVSQSLLDAIPQGMM